MSSMESTEFFESAAKNIALSMGVVVGDLPASMSPDKVFCAITAVAAARQLLSVCVVFLFVSTELLSMLLGVGWRLGIVRETSLCSSSCRRLFFASSDNRRFSAWFNT